MKKAILLCALCASVVMTSGCASLINGYVQTQGDMRDAKTARAAAFTVKAFDPEIGGPSISADVGQIISNLANNHPLSTAVSGGVDLLTYGLIANNQGWFPFSKSSKKSAPLAVPEFPTSTGRDTILIQGNGNTLDTSSGHNTSDNHSNPTP